MKRHIILQFLHNYKKIRERNENISSFYFHIQESQDLMHI